MREIIHSIRRRLVSATHQEMNHERVMAAFDRAVADTLLVYMKKNKQGISFTSFNPLTEKINVKS
jgi:hypothetical protein